ncbi:hypothetical protein Q7P35_001140 [Cladosporium inversicolor]
MRDLLALPATLLALIAASSTNAQGHLRPADLLPEHQAHIKRERQAQEQLQWQQPIGMRKMSSDEGEKFFLHYWDFGESATGSETMDGQRIDGAENYANSSTRLLAPLAPHFERAHTFRRFPGYSLFARDWGSCPSGTKSCASIERPNSCCGETDQCITVEDTGNGDVGCCPAGTVRRVRTKDAALQVTLASTLVATATSGRTSEEPSPSTSEQETDTVAVAGGVGGSTYTTTVENTVTETAPGTTSIGTITAPTTVTVTASPSETTEEPTETEEPSSTTSSEETAALPPSRPTGSSESSPESMTTITPEPTPSDASCPTGFYMCSAHYLGGCCRVGRNCDTTSCPTSDSTELVSNGVTIGGAGGVVAASTSTTTLDPEASSTASTQDNTCANGWFLCSESDGGGCCPADYVCGASCTATISGVANQEKQQPSGAEVVRWAWGFFMLALGTGVGMVWL